MAALRPAAASGAPGVAMSASSSPPASTSAATASSTAMPVGGIPQDAALHVVKGSLAASSLSAAYGCIRGTLRAEPAMIWGATYGFNTFTFAFPFFGLRDYVVSPLLAEVMTSARQQRDTREPHSLHLRNLASSTVSGTVVGGAMAGYLRGAKSILGGARTFGLVCLGLQILGNELRVLRMHFMASDWYAGKGSSASPPKHDALATSPSAQTTSVKPATSAQDAEASTTFAERLWTGLKSMSPVKRITEEEYEARLLKQRDHLRQAARELDEAIAHEAAAGAPRERRV